MNVDLLAMDVHGTRSDGCIGIGGSGERMNVFYARDGYIIADMFVRCGIVRFPEEPMMRTGLCRRVLAMPVKLMAGTDPEFVDWLLA